ncbi:MAG: DUF4870 domain-containing protein [Chthoniobacterales bacterium]
MPDPVDPVPPAPAPEPLPPNPAPPPGPTPIREDTSMKSNTTGLPSNVAAALACIPLIGGLIFYILEKHDSFVRFYAMQSIIFGGAWIIFDIISKIVFTIFGAVPALGTLLLILWGLVSALVHLAFLVVFIITVVKAFSGVRWEIPYIGPMAQKQVSGAA